jgi:hypothetical protein
MLEAIRELTDVYFLCAVFFNQGHLMFDLLIEIVDDVFFLMYFFNFFEGPCDVIDEYSGARIESVLEVAFIVEDDNLFVVLRKLLIDTIPIKLSLFPLTSILFGHSPSVKESLLELSFIKELILFFLIQLAIPVKLRISKLSLI